MRVESSRSLITHHSSSFVSRTDAGWVAMAFTDSGLSALSLPVKTRDQAERSFAAKGMAVANVETFEQISRFADDLKRYFLGERVAFELELDLSDVTEWQRRVLLKAAEIPYGELMTYGELAAAIGSPGGARAIGQAMARNPVPIIVPCHRVVAASGKLGGFSAGLDWKRRLLRLEGIDLGF